ncbi:MAG: DUF4118 domain-containing protein [Verrucomicrobiales bacterium]|nr:DUF4118 domain-containing protein [Verrucomicrobiales bacterium]
MASLSRSQAGLVPLRRELWRYGIAALFVAAAFAIRYSLNPLIGSQSPFMVFAPAALLAARFGGLGPGLATVIAGLVLGDFFFTPPFHSWGPYGPAETTLILTYTITTAVGVVLFHLLQHSRQQVEQSAEEAHAAAEQARRRGAELEREVQERQRTEAALQKAKEELGQYAGELEERVAERTTNLRESVRSLESVLYHVAHDLRAPLRAMQGFTSMLSKQYASCLDATGEDYARRVSESARRMDDLLQDLLEYGRVCHTQVMATKVDLNKLLSGVMRRLASEIQIRGAKVEVQYSLPEVWADAHLLDMILANLLSNALKFVPPGTPPRLEIWGEFHNGNVRLCVKDYGIGIAREHLERIFGIFERVHPEFDPTGTGIGLAIVRKAAHRMGAHVGVEAQPGEGSQFWVELPSAPYRPE